MISILYMAAQALTPSVVITPIAPLPTDTEFCAQLIKTAAATRPDLPLKMGSATTLNRFDVDCSTRSFIYEKSISATAPIDIERWKLGKAAAWSKLVCDSGLYGGMARKGWNFVTKFTFTSTETVTIFARCS